MGVALLFSTMNGTPLQSLPTQSACETRSLGCCSAAVNRSGGLVAAEQRRHQREARESETDRPRPHREQRVSRTASFAVLTLFLVMALSCSPAHALRSRVQYSLVVISLCASVISAGVAAKQKPRQHSHSHSRSHPLTRTTGLQ